MTIQEGVLVQMIQNTHVTGTDTSQYLPEVSVSNEDTTHQ